MILYIAVEPVSSDDNPLNNTIIFPVAYASATELVVKLAHNSHEAECVKLYRCEPLTVKEEAALWADLEARQIVCKHYIPMPGHPDYDSEIACANCMAENAKWEAADRAYDLSRGT